MAKDDMSAANWSREYCTSHLSFCFPVHKNWWYKSFGATTSYLWHVEISSEEINALGEGPLVVNLVSGSLAGTGNSDGEIRSL